MQFDKIVELLKKAKTVGIISHISPDGDTLGSGLALFTALKVYGISPYIFCDDEISEKLKYLPNVEAINNGSLPSYDLTFAVDCGDLLRLGGAVVEFNKGKTKIVVDHHKTNTRFGDINIINAASATAEILFELIDKLGVLNEQIAKLLYSGIVTDSGGFTYSSVNSNTLLVASELLKFNIVPHEICEHFLKKTSIEKFKLKARVLNNAKFYDNDTIGILHYTRDDFDATNTDNSSTEGIINEISNVETIKVAVSISEFKKEEYKISFRTGEDVDSSKIAFNFGGGGHKNAAGCKLYGAYEEVLEKILKAVGDEIC